LVGRNEITFDEWLRLYEYECDGEDVKGKDAETDAEVDIKFSTSVISTLGKEAVKPTQALEETS
jgi:hypothetical protein